VSDDDVSDGTSGQPDPHDPPWRLSLVDHRVHAWVGRDFLTQAWEARCRHTAAESQTAPDHGEPRCVDCVVGESSRLATRFDGLGERIHAGTVRELAADADDRDASEPAAGTGDPEPAGGSGELDAFLRRIEQRYAARMETVVPLWIGRWRWLVSTRTGRARL